MDVENIVSEKELIALCESLVLKHDDDFKLFISERNALNHVEYRAVLTVIVPIASGEAVLKELMSLTPLLSFKSSSVDATDERGVDILNFDFTLCYFNSVCMDE
ncbi:hypothetical protein [Campylobacter hyointestinalis]|uniref:hypothetical protein n=1 Tax=Campylobacter hyointestinalis TaxID=198 RepID=UPI001BD1FA4C|nr:hypothetical protein [Campylobacter hyointestinalis]MBT0611964.1 hypothetical protein [Campylobacter hyointestinalis subsp. hyointestinalis]MDY2999472.1 hypothetical protein [Campylobacter hyointestinalis]